MDVDGYTLWITGGSLVLIAPQVSELERREALGSLRHAQLLADGVMASRFDQHRRWYRAYRNALGRRGWRVTHSCQSVETAGGRTLLSPTQPLLLWPALKQPLFQRFGKDKVADNGQCGQCALGRMVQHGGHNNQPP
mgnify:CR=1 FL=1